MPGLDRPDVILQPRHQRQVVRQPAHQRHRRVRMQVDQARDQGVAVEAHVPHLLQAPVRQRQSLGEVVIRRGDQELGRVGVVADRDVAATGWLSWLWNRGVSTSATR